MATIIKTSGEIIECEPENKKDFSLKELQSIVGGYIELINLKDGKLMIVNEEGLINLLPRNKKASEMIDGFFGFIVGDVLICEFNQIK